MILEPLDKHMEEKGILIPTTPASQNWYKRVELEGPGSCLPCPVPSPQSP